MLRIVTLTIALFLLGNGGQAARILGVFPTPSISHQVVFRGLTMELAKRGHELVVITTDPINNPELQNFTEIELDRAYDRMRERLNFVDDANDVWNMMDKFMDFAEELSDMVYSNPKIQRIISKDSTEHFDLILVEYLFYDALYGLMSRLNAPMIAMASLPLSAHGHINIGNPLMSASSPDISVGYTDDMNFWQRLYNLYFQARYYVKYVLTNLPLQEKVMRTHLGDDIPPVDVLRADLSMVFVNSQPILSYARANLPNYLEIGGGFHLTKEKKELPKELKTFLDNAKEGFVYFSLGSNVKSTHLAAEKRNELMAAFAELPYKVVWKWESDSLPGKPDNVHISKWLPQQELLGHPNIRAFIYQGGLQSTEEAINNGVPLIGLPVFGDQEYNVNKVVSLGIAKRLYIETLSKDEIRDIVREVATDKSYKERILNVREILNDRMIDPLEQAVWWTEYVIRHKGAPHLRSKVRELTWYQRELLDVFAFLIAALVIGLYTVYKLFCYIARLSIGTHQSQNHVKIKRS